MHYRSESTERLFRAILNIETIEECYMFFEDLCTIKEIQDMVQRYDAANLLYDGVSYQKIAEEVSISSATISRVNRCLNYGEGGYKNAIEKMRKKESMVDDGIPEKNER